MHYEVKQEIDAFLGKLRELAKIKANNQQQFNLAYKQAIILSIHKLQMESEETQRKIEEAA